VSAFDQAEASCKLFLVYRFNIDTAQNSGLKLLSAQTRQFQCRL